jgi:hypothetical protein
VHEKGGTPDHGAVAKSLGQQLCKEERQPSCHLTVLAVLTCHHGAVLPAGSSSRSSMRP